MSEERQFTVKRFSGFDQAEVMSYIAQMKEREAAMQKEIETLTTKNAELKQQADFAVASLGEQKRRSERELAELQEKFDAAVADCAEKDAYSRTLEERLGSVMLDVRRFADTLISETTDRIDELSEETDASVNDNLQSVLEIAAELRECASQVGSMFEEMTRINDALAQRLREFLGTLRVQPNDAKSRLRGELDLDAGFGGRRVQDEQGSRSVIRVKRAGGGRKTGYVIPAGQTPQDDEPTD